ncbi:MAG TPA: copper chaperone PCu(A)C [Usitatibacteraceae bacterium]|nr:copper chaperone PCu(A)C [Usitatibacteraceae bacterium]
MNRTQSLLLLCGGLALAAHAQPPAPEVSNAWAKASLPGSSVSAAYLDIRSSVPLKLVKAGSPVAGIVEIHDMRMNNGVMEMKALPALEIPAGQVVSLKPGGRHIMLFKVKAPLKDGDKVPLELTFEGADRKPSVLKVDAIARAQAPAIK